MTHVSVTATPTTCVDRGQSWWHWEIVAEERITMIKHFAGVCVCPPVEVITHAKEFIARRWPSFVITSIIVEPTTKEDP